MATTIRDLLVRLGVDADVKTLKQFDAGMTTVVKGLTALAATGTAALGTLGLITASTARAGDEAAKAAKQLQLPVDVLQELNFAAQRSGASREQLSVGLKTLARQAFDAARGAGEGLVAFDKLGLKVKDVRGEVKPLGLLLGEASDALRGVDNEAEKIALAQKLFGEGGTALLPLLEEGSAGILELRRQARELGFVLDEQTARDAEAFQDALLDAELAATGLKTTIGAALLPVGADLLTFFKDAVVAARPFLVSIIDLIDNTVGIRTALALFAGAVATVSAAAAAAAGVLGVGALVSAIGSISAGASAAVGVLTGIAATAGVTLLPFLATLAGLFVFAAAQTLAFWGALAGGFLIIEDLVTFLAGGRSVVGEFVERFAQSRGPLGDVARLFLELRGLASQVLGLVRELGGLFVAVAVPALQELASALQPVVDLMGQLIGLFARSELRKVAQAARTATSILGGAREYIGGASVGAQALASSVNNQTSTTTNNTQVNAPVSVTGVAGPAETAGAVRDSLDGLFRRSLPNFAATEG